MSSQPNPEENPIVPLIDNTLDKSMENLNMLLQIPYVRRRLERTFKVKEGIKSTETYYNAKAAQSIICIIDEMIKDKGNDPKFEGIVLSYSDYHQWKPKTIIQRFRSASKYIVDHLDLDGRYSKWRAETGIEELEDGSGFTIKYMSESMELKFTKYRKISAGKLPGQNKDDQISPKDWKEALTTIVSELPFGSKQTISGLNLGVEDFAYLESFTEGLKSEFTFSWSEREIKILHAVIKEEGE